MNVDNLINDAHNLIINNIDDISDILSHPKGFWFYIGYNDKHEYYRSSILSESTRLNPSNWSNEEWVIVFNCDNDMDDMDFETEQEAWKDWLYNVTTDDLLDMIIFPKRDLTLPKMLELEYI